MQTSGKNTLRHGNRIVAWDGWRGIAILLVLCGHFYDLAWIHEDRMGVDIFFVLSGMLMSIILFEKRLSLRDFYIRRISRVFPLLLLLVVLMFTLSTFASIPYSFAELPASLLFIRTYFPTSPHIWSTGTSTAHLWSLNVEEHAYLILSILTLYLNDTRKVAALLILLALASFIISFYYYSITPTAAEFELKSIRTESAASFIFFSAGYGLLKRHYHWKLPTGLFIGLVLLAIASYSYSTPLWWRFSIAGVCLGITVNHLDRIPQWLDYLLAHPVIRWFGLCSFSLYMWQQVYFEYLWAIPGGRVTAIALVLATGATSFYWFENPVRHAINNRWSKTPAYRT